MKNLIKKLLFVLLSGAAQASVFAQTPLTLQQAITQGLQNRKDLQNQTLALQINEN